MRNNRCNFNQIRLIFSPPPISIVGNVVQNVSEWASTILVKSHPTMNTQSYPGQGLTIPQLLFALNEELKRAIHSPSCVEKVRRRLGGTAC